MSSATETRGGDAAYRRSSTPLARSQAPLLWITGLAGSGKSTLALALAERVRKRGVDVCLLDGDAVRNKLDGPVEHARHDMAARRERAWRLARIAHQAAMQERAVIVATISLLNEVHVWNRQQNAGYAEILLNAPWSELRRRRPALYGDAHRPAAKQVWGVDLVPQYPNNPELNLPHCSLPNALDIRVEAAFALWQRLDHDYSRQPCI